MEEALTGGAIGEITGEGEMRRVLSLDRDLMFRSAILIPGSVGWCAGVGGVGDWI